jgi:hypothetical protein
MTTETFVTWNFPILPHFTSLWPLHPSSQEEYAFVTSSHHFRDVSSSKSEHYFPYTAISVKGSDKPQIPSL